MCWWTDSPVNSDMSPCHSGSSPLWTRWSAPPWGPRAMAGILRYTEDLPFLAVLSSWLHMGLRVDVEIRIPFEVVTHVFKFWSVDCRITRPLEKNS